MCDGVWDDRRSVTDDSQRSVSQVVNVPEPTPLARSVCGEHASLLAQARYAKRLGVDGVGDVPAETATLQRHDGMCVCSVVDMLAR